MADVTTTSHVLRISCAFVDGDTRVYTLKRPGESLTAADIQRYSDFIAANNLLVGDKNAAPFSKITKAVRVNTLKTVLDIS